MDNTGQKPSQDTGQTGQPVTRSRAMLLTGIMRIICTLSDAGLDVIAAAVGQLQRDDMHDLVVQGCQLDQGKDGERGKTSDVVVATAALGYDPRLLSRAVDGLLTRMTQAGTMTLNRYHHTVRVIRECLTAQGMGEGVRW